MNSEPSQPNLISLEHIKTFNGGEDGFYKSVTMALSPRGEVIICDNGNYRVWLYNADLSLKLKFGNEGNGPGEFSKEVRRITATEDRIYLELSRRVLIFDYDGKYVNEVNPVIMAKNEIHIIKDEIHILYPETGNSRAIYNKDGELRSSVKIPTVESIMKLRMLAANDRNRNKGEIQTRIQYFEELNGFAEAVHSNYEINIYSAEKKLRETYKRKFKRHKRNLDEIIGLSLKNVSKEKRAIIEKQRQMLVKMYGEYAGDTFNVIAVDKDYIFVRTSAESLHYFAFDVLSRKGEYLTSYLHKEDKGTRAVIRGNLMLVKAKNDEIGPYAKLYKINFNKN
jgi:hypothetical protein